MKTVLRWFAWALSGLLVLLAVGIASVWAPDRSVEELSARWAQPPSRFVAVQGMQVHVRDEGPRDDPQPIVLLHGTSASLHTWDGWAAALSPSRRVIRFDLPGFGLTGPQPNNDYTIASYVHFVEGVLDQLGVSHCVLAGNSLGGQIAWATALDQRARVDKLVLVDSGGLAMAPKSIPIGFLIARLPGVRRLMLHVLPRALIASSVRNLYGDPARVTPELIERYYELTLRAGNREALGFRMDQLSTEDAGVLRALKLPTLILWGRRDLLIPVENAQKFASAIAGAQLVVWDDLGHLPQEEDPQRTVQAVRAFLK